MQPGDVGKLQGLASDDAVIHVAKDLYRTQPGQLNDEQFLSLQRVLLAYAARNPAVGYCQGMNFMAAVFIILGFGEDEAFSGLSYFLEKVCPGCHDPDLGGFHRDAEVLDQLVQRFLPALHLELELVGVRVNLLAIDHFMSLTSRTWPLEATVRLWDIILLEGPCVIFASFLALLELFILLTEGSTWYCSCLEPSADDTATVAGCCSCSRLLLASMVPDGSLTAFDVMESFKRESLHGVTGQLDAVFAHVHKYLQLIPDSLIEDLRVDVMEAN